MAKQERRGKSATREGAAARNASSAATCSVRSIWPSRARHSARSEAQLRPPQQLRFVFRQERRSRAAWAFPSGAGAGRAARLRARGHTPPAARYARRVVPLRADSSPHAVRRADGWIMHPPARRCGSARRRSAAARDPVGARRVSHAVDEDRAEHDERRQVEDPRCRRRSFGRARAARRSSIATPLGRTSP